MDIVNPTADSILLVFDGQPYKFEPRTVVTVSEEAGNHLMLRGPRLGLVVARWGDDINKLKLAGLRSRSMYYTSVLKRHELANKRQAELKFPPIPESQEVARARVAAPIYEKAVGKLEAEVGNNDSADYANQLEDLLIETELEVPSLAAKKLSELREEADKLGLEYDPKWNARTLLKRIADHKQPNGRVAPAPPPPTVRQLSDIGETMPGPVEVADIAGFRHETQIHPLAPDPGASSSGAPSEASPVIANRRAS